METEEGEKKEEEEKTGDKEAASSKEVGAGKSGSFHTGFISCNDHAWHHSLTRGRATQVSLTPLSTPGKVVLIHVILYQNIAK